MQSPTQLNFKSGVSGLYLHARLLMSWHHGSHNKSPFWPESVTDMDTSMLAMQVYV